MAKQLIVLELNEINFNVVEFYVKSGVVLAGFSELFRRGIVETESEPLYHNLEPWIQ